VKGDTAAMDAIATAIDTLPWPSSESSEMIGAICEIVLGTGRPVPAWDGSDQ